jgi:prepilin-type N-terminal cleavage/methylation domain-containing protein
MHRHGLAFDESRSQRGVTLLELICSLAVLGMLLPVVAIGLSSCIAGWNGMTERLEAREQALMLVMRIEREVREGSDFAVTSDGLLFLNDKGMPIRYQLSSGGFLLRNEQGVGVTVIGSKLRSCMFGVESGGLLVHLRAVTQVGNAEVRVDELFGGRTK